MTTRDRSLPRMMTVALLAVCGASAWAAAPAIPVTIELDDGTRDTGTLLEIGAEALRITTADGAPRAVPLPRARTLDVTAGTPSPPAPARLRVTLTDGTTLDGDDFLLTAAGAGVSVAAGRVDMPGGRVQMVEWPGPRVNGRAAWQDAVPDGVASDLVVIGKADGFEFVECAITAVGPDTVTVVLDDETIPVKRSKIIGLRWLRPAPVAQGGVLIDVVGGRLRADAVAWTPAGLVLDGGDAERTITLPATMLEGIDFAAGRTTALATIPPERLDVEPFFAALGGIDALGGFFGPRPLPAETPAGRPGLVMRPRTVAVWRIPPRSRRFRARLAGGAGSAPAVVMITVDERRAFEKVVSADEPAEIDIDLVDGRRLAVTVDFGVDGGLAGAVRFLEPTIEQ